MNKPEIVSGSEIRRAFYYLRQGEAVIVGDAISGKRLLDFAKQRGIRATIEPMGVVYKVLPQTEEDPETETPTYTELEDLEMQSARGYNRNETEEEEE